MTGKTINLILLGVLVGVLLGGILGAIMPGAMSAAGLVGTLYVNALAIVAIVLVLVGFPLALARYGDLRRFDNDSAGKFIITVFSAVVVIAVGVVLVRLVAAEAINPHGTSANLLTDLFGVETRISGDYLGMLIPVGLMRSVIEGSYLGWVIFALIFGMVLPTISSRTRTLHSFLEDLCGTMNKVSELLLVVAPVAMIFIAGALVGRNGLGFGEMFSELWYPLVLVIAIVLYAAVVLPLAVNWWQKTHEIRGRREEPQRGRPGGPMMSSRPGQRPMGQDRGRGRDQRYDRDRGPRDRDQRPDRGDRERGDRDRGDRDRGDRDRGDRYDRGDRRDRGDRDRGRRDFNRDRSDSPRPEPVRRETPREDSPFAVSSSAHTFDPEVPDQQVALPKVEEDAVSVTPTESRPQADSDFRRDQSDRPDRGPRDNDRRDRGRGGRDRQGRGGRDRDRDRGRGDRPRRFERPAPTESAQPSGATTSTPSGSEDLFDGGSDRLAESVFGAGGSAAFEPTERTMPERSNGERESEPEAPRYSRPEPVESSSDESDQPKQFGRPSHAPQAQEESPSSTEKPKEPERPVEAPKAIDHYSPEGIEFGRGNRRKNRR